MDVMDRWMVEWMDGWGWMNGCMDVRARMSPCHVLCSSYWLPGIPPSSSSHTTTPTNASNTLTHRHSVDTTSPTTQTVNVRPVHVQSAHDADGTPTASAGVETPRKRVLPSLPTPPSRSGLFRTLLFYLRDPLLSKILVILILFYISTKAYRDSLLITLQTRFALEPVDLGWISSYLGILSATIQGVALKPMTKRWDERTLTFICLVRKHAQPMCGSCTDGMKRRCGWVGR